MTQTTEQLTYSARVSAGGHCRAAITAVVAMVPGVSSVAVDLDAKRVTVGCAELDDDAVRAAIDEAGYDLA